MSVYLYQMRDSAAPVYLDYHATTPVDPRVLEVMWPWFSQYFGNPASRSHSFGWQAAEAVDIARTQVAQLLHADAKEIIFTSGATEALNLAIKGHAEAFASHGKHIITITTEHHAVLDALAWLSSKGYEVTKLEVNASGQLDLQKLQDALTDQTILVVAMWANNETGVLHDIPAIGAICRQAGVTLLCDATQAAGKLDINPAHAGVDMLAFSAHKMYGPKGVGALYINQAFYRVKPVPLIHGGGHEMGLRSGTLNVPGIVGFGAAAVMRMKEMKSDEIRIRDHRDHFEAGLLAAVEEAYVNGDLNGRLPTVSNIRVTGVDSQAVMSRFRTRLAISAGSACSSAHPEPSHVLLAMGLTVAQAKGSFRISFGAPTTREEVTLAIEWLTTSIAEERNQSPLWQLFTQGVDIS